MTKGLNSSQNNIIEKEFTLKNKFNDKEIAKKDHNSIEYRTEYILGPGDIIKFGISGLPDFNSEVKISVDGFINLKEIDLIYVEGYTIKELKKLLEEEYEKYVFDPNVNLEIVKYRPVSIYISGEVQRPGLYSFNLAPNKTYVKGVFPSVYDAIIRAKGIRSFADISNIEIIRKNKKSDGGGYIKTNLNFVELISNGNQDQNIVIFDGDNIIVNKSEFILKEQILKVNSTNLSSPLITVYVSGNVETRGETQLRRGASLVEAISYRGGTKLLSGDVEFIRFNDDGTTQRNKFKFDRNAPLNSYENPILMNGDIINVNRTILGKTTEIIGEVSSPLFSGYGLYRFFSDV